MKSSEIIGALRDLVDKISKDDVTQPVNVYPAEKRFVPVEVPKAPEDLAQQEKDKELPLDTMVPPLQQKIELLKRAVDIDNVFDGTPIDKTADHQGDYKQEIKAISRNAGINPVVLDAAGDDEPLDV